MYNVFEIWQKKNPKPAYGYDMNISRKKDQKDTDQVVDSSCLWVIDMTLNFPSSYLF